MEATDFNELPHNVDKNKVKSNAMGADNNEFLL